VRWIDYERSTATGSALLITITAMWLFDLLSWPWVSRAQSRGTQESAQGCQRPLTRCGCWPRCSAQAATAFAAEAAQMLALNKAAQDELMRTGTALTEIARMYSEADAAAAGSLLANPLANYRLAG